MHNFIKVSMCAYVLFIASIKCGPITSLLAKDVYACYWVLVTIWHTYNNVVANMYVWVSKNVCLHLHHVWQIYFNEFSKIKNICGWGAHTVSFFTLCRWEMWGLKHVEDIIYALLLSLIETSGWEKPKKVH